MNEREKQICSRVGELRERLKWSQRNFAKLVGMTHNQLASVEYGRTPLKSEIAFRLAVLTSCNLKWLAEGGTEYFSQAPSIQLISQVSPQSIFSEAWSGILKKSFRSEINTIEKSQPAEADDEASIQSYLSEEFEGLLKYLPPQFHNNFYSFISKAGHDFVAMNLPEINRLKAELSEPLQNSLTLSSLKSNNKPVKSELEKLLERVRRIAARTGAKADLARFLKVAPARVTEWLTEDSKKRKEPGGHYTLELLKWVEQQERQK